MIRHSARNNRRYPHYYHSVNMYTILSLFMMLAIGYGNSGAVASMGNGGAITIHTVETKSLKQLQIERSLERHRVGR